ncbi:MAG: hypothetical protein L0312_34170, partial [Acidobacteria bacterium]|nr:hypothetical protein [Acidobacteriota bacterium]
PEVALDVVQTGVSAVGLVPGAGEVADLANAGISVARGNKGEAVLDLAGAAGPVGSGIAVGNRIRKIAGAVGDTAQAVNKTDNAADAARAKNLADAEKKGIPKDQLGPSGKPKVHTVNHPTKKRAEDAARADGQGKPAKDTRPKKGGPHFHPTNKDGTRKKGKQNVHHEYPG